MLWWVCVGDLVGCKTCEVLARINVQSPDIVGGVHVGEDDMDGGAGDRGIMFGYAIDETEDALPPGVLSCLGRLLNSLHSKARGAPGCGRYFAR